MNNKLILLFIIFILNFFKINCNLINFNNSIINECTKLNPCSLTVKESWENGIVPVNGDEVIINFNNLTTTTNEIYLICENLEIQLSSFNLYGLNNFVNLNLLNSNLTINKMVINYSNLTINGCINKFKEFNTDSSNLIVSNSIIECDNSNFNNNSTSNFTIIFKKSSNFISNNQCIFNLPVYQNDGIFNLNNQVLIGQSFNSNGLFNYTGKNQLLIQSSSTFNQLVTYSNINLWGQNISINGSLVVFDTISGINLYNGSSLTLSGSINNDYNLVGNEITIYDNSTLNLISGYSILVMNPNLFGTINIIDSGNTTSFSSNNTINKLNLNCNSDLILNGASINSLLMKNSNSVLNITNSSTLKLLLNNGTTLINLNKNLNLNGNFFNSFSFYTNIYGALNIYNQLFDGKYIQILSSGTLMTYNSTINVPITGSYNSTIINGKSNQSYKNESSTFKSLSIDTEGQLIINNNLTIISSLTLQKNSIIQFNQVQLNNGNSNKSMIDVVNGSVILDQINIQIKFQSNVNQPKNNDSILLIQTPINETINYITTDKIDLLNLEISKLSYKIIQNDNLGTISLIFTSADSSSGLKPIYIIGIVILSIIILIILITTIIYIRKRKFHQNGGELQKLIEN